MRDFDIGKLVPARTRGARQSRVDYFAPSRRGEHENEVFQVLWEIGIHLAALLGIALVVHLFVVLLGASPTPT